MAEILVADKLDPSTVKVLVEAGHTVRVHPQLQDQTLIDAVAEHSPEVLVVRSTKVPEAAIRASARLGLIVRAGAGIDNVDCSAASACGVAVANCPGMNAAAVAELAMGLLLACDRSLPDQAAKLRAGKWDKQGFGATCRGLKGRTLGLVGVGSIGKLVIDRALAFDMNVVAWSRNLDETWCAAKGVGFGGRNRAALLKMASGCDAVSVHVALVPETTQLCDGEFFAALKPGAIFVNTARAGVVDEAALRGAVLSRGVRCGLDVHENQPSASTGPFSSETCSLAGVYGTHHNGASTAQAQEAVGEETVRIIRAFAEHGELVNCVNEASLRTRASGSGAKSR